jgi:hypothetical protein
MTNLAQDFTSEDWNKLSSEQKQKTIEEYKNKIEQSKTVMSDDDYSNLGEQIYSNIQGMLDHINGIDRGAFSAGIDKSNFWNEDTKEAYQAKFTQKRNAAAGLMGIDAAKMQDEDWKKFKDLLQKGDNKGLEEFKASHGYDKPLSNEEKAKLYTQISGRELSAEESTKDCKLSIYGRFKSYA